MCMVSAVMDYGRRDMWPPNRLLGPAIQPWPQPYPASPVPPVPKETPEEKLREFLKMYEAAKEYDRKTEQPHCEDPAKMQVLDRILERLDEIEKRLVGEV